VITTTSVPMALANTFGDRSEVCYGPCDPGSTIWFAPVDYAREVARATGVSEVTVLAQMSAYARRDVTAHSYARDVIADWHRYRDDPAAFIFRLHPPGADGAEWIRTWTDRALEPLVWLAAAGMLVVTRRSRRWQLLSVLVKVGLLALLVQPFVHMAGTRYWSTAAPLAALSAMLAMAVVGGWLLDLLHRRARRTALRPAAPAAPPSRLLILAQAVPAIVGLGAVVSVRMLA
jgi:hypothetical protein